jgi:Putative prokaryotic signal transducing protein
MENDWVIIFSTGNYYRAQLAREILSDEGIDSVIINKTDSIYLHPSGYIEVHIQREDVIKAMHLLKSAQFE